jgi:hypothetical protein
MPDPVTGLTIGAAIAVAAKQAQEFIAAVSGHPGESIGTILGTITKRRLDNAEAVGNQAYLTLLNIGIEPEAVPLSVLVPALEGASLQEEPPMQEMWANLLANAADPRKIAPVAATFPAILRELSARDVRFLDAIEKDRAKHVHTFDFLTEDKLRLLFDEATKAVDDGSESGTDSFEYSFAVLRRHNLISESIEPRTVDRSDRIKNPRPDVEIELHVDYTLSELGRCFIAVCRGPVPKRTS